MVLVPRGNVVLPYFEGRAGERGREGRGVSILPCRFTAVGAAVDVRRVLLQYLSWQTATPGTTIHATLALSERVQNGTYSKIDTATVRGNCSPPAAAAAAAILGA